MKNLHFELFQNESVYFLALLIISISTSLCFKSFPNFVCTCTLCISLLQNASLHFKSLSKFLCTCTLNLALPIVSIGVSLLQNCHTLCVLPLFIIYSLCCFVQV
ncbi:hypothetical protein IW261DRAFT_1490673 [Armillaria novae-zelandiae]|uniref:Uncharacterized protein n=1 Tax=Armillaria novae-zelandiae TaxID=153914 RepID=A0AA39P2E8_9AGAR|nr:hypothetical protein IW261DRAFT_1490673 [Armillaria novae-zelandiae]